MSTQSRVGPMGFRKAVLDSESSWSWSATYTPGCSSGQKQHGEPLHLYFVLVYSLSTSLIKTTVAANARRHGGHPAATGSRHLDRYVTGHCHGPTVYVRIPSAVRFFFSCTKKLKSRVTSGSPNVGTLVKSLFISLRPFPIQVPTPRSPYQTLLWL